MNLYISDTHFGHRNVINFDRRPFADINQMNYTIMALWNDRVRADDDVWILGDFCYHSERAPEWYLRQLKGHKHLIIGNHDKVTLESKNAYQYLESLDIMVNCNDYLNKEEVQVVLMHYPMVEWPYIHSGAYHLFGHIHNRLDDTYYFMKERERAFNVGCMINNYAPASLREIIENNKRFYETNEKMKAHEKEC